MPIENLQMRKIVPFSPILEGGLTTWVGQDTAIVQNRFFASIGFTLPANMSGIIQSVLIVSEEIGTGAVQVPQGMIYVFDVNPTIAANDATITTAEHETLIARIPIVSADWASDVNGATAHKAVDIPFHEVSTLYFAFFMTSATPINDVAGDDEILKFNFWYKRES